MLGLHKERMASFRDPDIWTFLLQLRDEMSWHMYKEFVFQLSSSACWWDQGWSRCPGDSFYSSLADICLPLWLQDATDSHCPASTDRAMGTASGVSTLRAFNAQLGRTRETSNLSQLILWQNTRKWKPVWTANIFLFAFSHLLDQNNLCMSIHLKQEGSRYPPWCHIYTTDA